MRLAYRERMHQWVRARVTWLRQGTNWQQAALLAVVVVCIAVTRLALLPVFTSDYTVYMGVWLETLRADGFGALGEEFANYNFPYLYLLLIFGQLPFDGLTVVKLIAFLFDGVLAIGVGAIAFHLRQASWLAVTAGATALLLPEVLLNSAMWGQADSTYAAFLTWTLYFMLARRPVLMWIMYALALEFKLQAIFLLPLMALAFVLQRHRARVLLGATVVVVTLSLPALLAGRSVSSVFGIYVAQTEGGGPLALNVANMYQWINPALADVVRPAGVALAVAVTALLCACYLHAITMNVELSLMRAAVAFAGLIPFTLPQMHDRYFYAAGLLAAVCILFDRRYVLPAAMFQFVAVQVYSRAILGGEPVFTYPQLAVLQLIAVSSVVYLSLSSPRAPDRDQIVADSAAQSGRSLLPI